MHDLDLWIFILLYCSRFNLLSLAIAHGFQYPWRESWSWHSPIYLDSLNLGWSFLWSLSLNHLLRLFLSLDFRDSLNYVWEEIFIYRTSLLYLRLTLKRLPQSQVLRSHLTYLVLKHSLKDLDRRLIVCDSLVDHCRSWLGGIIPVRFNRGGWWWSSRLSWCLGLVGIPLKPWVRGVDKWVTFIDQVLTLFHDDWELRYKGGCVSTSTTTFVLSLGRSSCVWIADHRKDYTALVL